MEETSVNYFGLSALCRLCLRRDVTLLDIFHFSAELKNEVADAIMTCVPIQITKRDSMPNFICQLCYTQLVKIHQFQMEVLQSDKTLRRYLQQICVSDKKNEIPSEDPLIHSTNANMSIKSESFEHQSVFDMFFNCEKKSPMNSAKEIINNDIFLKPEIKDEPIDDERSLLSTNYSANMSMKCESLELPSVFDMDVNCEKKSPMNSAKEIINNDISLESEIKDEPMDDEKSLLSTNYNYTEFTGDEDLNISIGDTKVGVMDMNLNINGSEEVSVTTNEINKDMFLKSEMKNEPTDNNSSVSRECVHDTVNALFNRDDIAGDIKIDIGHTSREFANLRSAEVTEHFNNREESNKGISANNKKSKRSTEEIYQCDVCKKCFSSAFNLKRHNRVHNGEKLYDCDFCKKSFSSAFNLKIHKYVHTGEKPHQCDVCKMCFSVASTLKTHIRLHTGEKPYQCNVCNKCFTTASNLKTHNYVHTGEKPHQCDVCKKRFSTTSEVKKHNRVHHK